MALRLDKMNDNFILTIDNVFSKEICKSLIKEYSKKLKKEDNKYRGYQYFDIDLKNFSHYDLLLNCIYKYKEKYPEVNLTSSFWNLTNLRYKMWKKGSFFKEYHSEHCFLNPYRILAIQLYLTSHKCGTEFFNKKIINSEIGRVCIFPAYFTHTHKGQPDLKKSRSILTGYVEFVAPGTTEK